MSTAPRHSLRRLIRPRKRGQSIPIIALMIVILVAMVGLSVDVGNTFSQERKAVSASNAAALAGMKAYVNRPPGATDQSILNSIKDSLKSNGVDLSDPNIHMSAFYLNSQGGLLSDHPVVGSGSEAPANVAYIQVKLDGKVDTSFARVVGRNDLPINATAHAGLCPITTMVLPLGIDKKTITDNSFNSDGTTKAPPEYVNLGGGIIQRRVYVKQDAPGGFSWLRWQEDKGALGQSAVSANELAASMTSPGNIGAGFDEAPWPAGETAAKGYPSQPGTLSEGDWVWGTPGWKGGSSGSATSVDAAIRDYIANKTFLILPIYSDIRGQGSNMEVHVEKLGAFIITNQGKDKNDSYFDMIYLGPPKSLYTACPVTPPPPSNDQLDLFGNVSFFPEYPIIPTSQQPIQYVVVLDSSGSMSANFDGQCNEGGATVQCANGPTGAPEVQVTDTGAIHYWKTREERRIYVAKQALDRLVTLSNMPGNPGYTTTRPDDQMAVVWFSHNVPVANTQGFSNTPASIKSFIDNLNTTAGDKYRSQGGTNGAAGLYRAGLLYNSAGPTVRFNGNDVKYKRVVLFITDGVSNQFLDKSKCKPNSGDCAGGSSSANTYDSGSSCANMGKYVVESASCQTTRVGGTYNGWDRPITQMITTSQDYLRSSSINAEVFVIALSNIPSTGLQDGIPSSSNYFASAAKLIKNANGTTNVDEIIDKINAKVEQGTCTPGPNGTVTGSITSAEFVNGKTSMTYPQVGEVIIDSPTNHYVAPIMADTDGSLSYVFTDIQEGDYTMQAYIWYHHPDDLPGAMRMYSQIFDGTDSATSTLVPVHPSTQGTSFTQRVPHPLTLKLTGDVCAAPGA